MLVNRESEQMTFSTKFDALLQSNVAACTEVINTKDISALHTRRRDLRTPLLWTTTRLTGRCRRGTANNSRRGVRRPSYGHLTTHRVVGGLRFDRCREH